MVSSYKNILEHSRVCWDLFACFRKYDVLALQTEMSVRAILGTGGMVMHRSTWKNEYHKQISPLQPHASCAAFGCTCTSPPGAVQAVPEVQPALRHANDAAELVEQTGVRQGAVLWCSGTCLCVSRSMQRDTSGKHNRNSKQHTSRASLDLIISAQSIPLNCPASNSVISHKYNVKQQQKYPRCTRNAGVEAAWRRRRGIHIVACSEARL